MMLIQFILFNGCNNPHSQPNSKTPPEGSTKLINKTSVNTSDDKKIYLFDIYSEKRNIDEAVNEIALKQVQKFKTFKNNEYIKKGDSQRMEDYRVTVVECRKGKLDNLVEGGTLWVYAMEYELKPKEPDKFVPMWVLETLQDNGWVYNEGTELLIYHENGKNNNPFYLAEIFLTDELFVKSDDGKGKSVEEVVIEIIKSKVPKLKLIKKE